MVSTIIVAFIGALQSYIAYAETLTPDDYLYYGISLKQPGEFEGGQLLNLIYGDPQLQGIANPEFADRQFERPRTRFRFVDRAASIEFSRSGNDNVRVVRETFNEATRQGTKLLDVQLLDGRCRERGKPPQSCDISLILRADGADRGVKRAPRTVEISTSTGITRRFRSPRRDGSKPLDQRSYRRSAAISNFAIELLSARIRTK
jgi:hypothetical protein